MTDLNKLLNYLEDKIDIYHYTGVEKLHIQSMDYKEVIRVPLSVDYPKDERVVSHPYSKVFEDNSIMLYNELACIENNVLNSVEVKDDYPLQIRPNYGVGLIPSLLGAGTRLAGNSMPWVDHLNGTEEIKRIIDAGIPDLDTALGRKARECCEYYLEILEKYPKCKKAIHITQPDLQGPIDILHMLIGYEVFYLLYDDPALIHNLLNLITETYIAYHRFIDPYTTGNINNGEKSYVHFGIYGGRVVIKDDTATANISKEMYEEFALPYNTKILKALGGGSIHFCGAQKDWHYDCLAAQPISSLNFGNSEKQNLESLSILTSKKISIIAFGAGQEYSFVKHYVESGFDTGFTWMIKAKNRQEALRKVREHRSHKG